MLAIASGVLGSSPALASQPVPRTLTGCVVGGSFVTSDGYVINPRYPDGRRVDLAAFEGRKVTIRGDLLPGDLLIVKRPPRDRGRCNQKPDRPTPRNGPP